MSSPSTAVAVRQAAEISPSDRPQPQIVGTEQKLDVVGRLRLGGPKRPVLRSGKPLIGRNGKPVMGFGEALDRFRATALERDDLEELARVHGDPATITPWDSPDGPAWQTVLTASVLPVLLFPLPDTLVGPRYEAYNGSHAMQKYCDGQIAMVPNPLARDDKTQPPWIPRPCSCDRSDADACARVTRLKVGIRGIPFRGVWDVVCHGNYAAQHWTNVVIQAEYLSRQQDGRPIAATLSIKEKKGRSAVFGPHASRVPVLRLEEAFVLMPGAAQVPQIAAPSGPTLPPPSEDIPPDDAIDVEATELTGTEPGEEASVKNNAQAGATAPQTDVATTTPASSAQSEGQENGTSAGTDRAAPGASSPAGATWRKVPYRDRGIPEHFQAYSTFQKQMAHNQGVVPRNADELTFGEIVQLASGGAIDEHDQQPAQAG
jgi:hypothetical protein